jgi:Regulator of chromosome condensation (RCC1) repeat
MRCITWKSIVLAFVLWQAGSTASIVGDAHAQFLGQQSLSQSSYVIDQSGQLWAWGDNFYGQLGVGDRTNRNTPTLVPLPEGASKWVLVAGGANFAIAVADSDKIYTWGLNDKGQIGNGTPDGLYAVPTRIQNPPYTTTWKWVSAGAAHCEALTTDGRLFAWGNNTQGELGVGTTEYIITPLEVQFPTGITAWADVAAGPGYTMMITPDGLLYGCGMDSLSTFDPREGPVLGEIDPFRAISPLPCIAASYRLETRIDEYFFAGPAYNYLYEGPDGGAPNSMAAVADGGWHALLLNVSGTLIAAGDNTYGQLGVGSDAQVQNGTVRFPSGVTQFVAIAAGLKHSLAVGNDGWLYAWGDNNVGELGTGNFTNQSKPVRVLQVCNPLAMTASFTAPAMLVPGYTITLSVHDDANSSALTNTNAFLVLNQPLTYLDSTPDERYNPHILPNDTASLSWNITDSTNLFLDTPIYFAYVQANGSSPLLISGRTIVPAEWVTAHVYGTVVDSITGKPVSDAQVLVQVAGSSVVTETTDQDGNFYDTLRLLKTWSFEIVKENYSTFYYPLQEEIDSLDIITIPLGPSDIEGTFALPATPMLADSMQQVYYPDSLVGYALSRSDVFRTLDSGITWTGMFGSNADLHDVKFRDPGNGWILGNGGTILNTTDTGETWQPGSIFFGDTNSSSMYFLNAKVGFARNENGVSSVTYDGSKSWAPMPEFPHPATSINFFSLAGHGASDNGVLNYDGEPSVVSAIVRGRITYGNPPEPIMGAEIDRYYMVYYNGVPLYNYIDTTYTNEQGNFVFSGIDGVFPYQYLMHFTDSGIAKTQLFSNIQGHRHEITTLNYNDYTPPPPDTILADVPLGSEPNLSLNVSASQSLVRIAYSIPSDGAVRLIIHDVLGRTVSVVQDGFVAAGQYEKDLLVNDLPDGSYFVTVESSQPSLTKKFMLIR